MILINLYPYMDLEQRSIWTIISLSLVLITAFLLMAMFKILIYLSWKGFYKLTAIVCLV